MTASTIIVLLLLSSIAAATARAHAPWAPEHCLFGPDPVGEICAEPLRAPWLHYLRFLRADVNQRRAKKCLPDQERQYEPTRTVPAHLRRASVRVERDVRLPVAKAASSRCDPRARVISIILQVFGRYGPQAVEVSRCETGGTFWVGASNGQYKGIFQMGASERATYGHGPGAWAQARAAYRYFVASGRDWSPWACKP